MTPRERARIALCDDPDDMDEDWLTGVITEHVRALLADDEVTIEIMARALVIRTAEHYGDLLPIDLDLSLTKLLARAVLAALRRKALGKKCLTSAHNMTCFFT